MPYTYTLTSVVPASAQDIYDAWLDSLGHSEMTGSKAAMSAEVGAEVSAWDGYITGRNLDLVPGERIVQAWRTRRFTDEHEDSIITVTLEESGDSTLLTLVHSNVPDDQRSYEEGGWESNYFEPMKVYFAALGQDVGVQPAQPRAAKKASRRVKASRGRTKPSRGRTKPSRGRTKTKRAEVKTKPKSKPKSKAKPKQKSKAKQAKPRATKAAKRRANPTASKRVKARRKPRHR